MRIVTETGVFDVHTHQYPPSFKTLFSVGIDDLVTYHYLVAELFRSSDVSSRFVLGDDQDAAGRLDLGDTVRPQYSSSKHAGRRMRDGRLWSESLLSFAEDAREFFSAIEPADVMQFAGVADIVMTNDVFDPKETAYWESSAPVHPKLHAALRMDTLLNKWEDAHGVLTSGGDAANAAPMARVSKARAGFSMTGFGRMKPVYIAVSLPPNISVSGRFRFRGWSLSKKLSCRRPRA